MSVIREALVAVLGSKDQKIVRSYINGDWVIGAGTKASSVVNPATEETIAWTHDVSEKQLDETFAAARQAQLNWHYEVGIQEKEAIFRYFADYLDIFKGQLAWVAIKEGGKLWKWAGAEVQETIDTIWHYHGEVSRVEGMFSRCQTKNRHSIVTRDPYGVVVGITPWNFPLAVPWWKIAAALACGNSIIVKDAEQTPTVLSLSVYLFHEAVKFVLGKKRAGELAGVLQVVHGRGETIGKYIIENGDYDKIAFTGGTETGKVVAETCGRRLKKCSMELGGHAGIILMDDYDLDRAVRETLNAMVGDSGQRCVSAREMFVHQDRYKEFTKLLVEALKQVRIGDPGDYKTVMGPLISQEQINAVENGILDSVGRMVNSHKIVLGGRSMRKAPEFSGVFSIDPEVFKRGYYFAPTVLVDLPPHAYARKNEVFGPVLCVTPVFGSSSDDIFEKALDLMNSSCYGLSNSILTDSLARTIRSIERVKTGIQYNRRGPTGAEVGKYFGGVKSSGWGREGRGIEEFTYVKQVYLDSDTQVRMAQTGADDKVKDILDKSKSAIEEYLT